MTRPTPVQVFICFSLLALFANRTVAQKTPIDKRVIRGNWKITLQPYSGPEFESMPLQVISVRGEWSRESSLIWIRERRLRNRSDKRASKANFSAFVYREQDPETLLFQHFLGTVGFDRVPVLPGTEWPAPCLDPKKYCPYGHAIPGPATLLAPLVQDGTLDGEYRIAIGVSKVWFRDGSIWELPGIQPGAENK